MKRILIAVLLASTAALAAEIKITVPNAPTSIVVDGVTWKPPVAVVCPAPPACPGVPTTPPPPTGTPIQPGGVVPGAANPPFPLTYYPFDPAQGTAYKNRNWLAEDQLNVDAITTYNGEIKTYAFQGRSDGRSTFFVGGPKPSNNPEGTGLFTVWASATPGGPPTNKGGKMTMNDIWGLQDGTVFGPGWHCFNITMERWGKSSVEMHTQPPPPPPQPSGRP